MTSVRMCGVVLWSCPDDGRAVIWCEDHGKLAFYAEAKSRRVCCDMHRGVALDAGDLIEFDVEDEQDKRRAHNPRLLVADHAPCIATDLQRSAQPDMRRNGVGLVTRNAAETAEVVPFVPRARARAAQAAG